MAGLGEILEENTRLRESLAEREREVAALLAQLGQKNAMLEALRDRAEDLARRLEMIRIKQERARNERFVPDGQAALPFVSDVTVPPRDPEAQAAEEAQRAESGSKAPKNRAVTHRRNARADTSKPHKTVRVPVKPARCPSCHGEMAVTGTTSSGRYDWVPGHFVIHDVEREQCACPRCPEQGSYAASEPYLLPRALCGNGLLVRVIVDKFADHLPLHRQASRMEREGFEVSTSTLSGWIAQAAEQLGPLAKAVQKQVIEGPGPVLGDDTGMPVQDGADGKLRAGRLWAFTDQEQAFFAFTATKQGEHPAALLAKIGGDVILVDGGSEFNEAVRKLGLERAGCWAHLRRYFFDARAQHDEAAIPLMVIRDLFLIERDVAGTPPEHRLAVRKERSKPLVDALYAWIRDVSRSVRPSSTLGEAVTYARNQEERMRMFLAHGELPIHNNLSELLLRSPVVGRKNWLFAGSEGGAKAAAILFTLVGSCMLQGIDPYAYLVDMAEKLPDWPSNRVHELTPKSWRAALEAAAIDA